MEPVEHINVKYFYIYHDAIRLIDPLRNVENIR